MIKIKFFPFLVLFVFAALCGCTRISTLMEYKRSGQRKQQISNQETRSYERLKKYIEEEKIQKGASSQDIRTKCGEPVLINPYQAGEDQMGEKWAYKPATASWFSKEKIYLYFDESGNLSEWEVVASSKINDGQPLEPETVK